METAAGRGGGGAAAGAGAGRGDPGAWNFPGAGLTLSVRVRALVWTLGRGRVPGDDAEKRGSSLSPTPILNLPSPMQRRLHGALRPGER